MWVRHSWIVTAAVVAVLATSLDTEQATAQAASDATVFHNVRVFDGTRLVGVRDVVIAGGWITALGTGLATPAGATVVDGTGATLLPGLIDAHAHVFGDALEQALVFGVTTELDMFTEPHYVAALRAEQRAANVASRADVFSAGVLATAPKGHGTEYGMKIPTIDSPDSAQAWVDGRIAEGSDYIKIVYDDGSTYGIHIPTISRETLAALVAAAHARGKLAVVHIGSLADARAAIAAGADGLAHLFVDRSPDAGFGAFVAAHHAFVVPTLTVLRSVAGLSASGELAADARLGPYLSPTGRGTISGTFPTRSVPSSYAAAEEAVKQLRSAGVPILAGTDAPNPGTAHGIALHRELELLVKAGLTATEALAAATSVPARAFKLGDRGRIGTGQRADLLLVRGDPTSDITATRDIIGVWKGGARVRRTPAVISSAATGPASAPTSISSFDDGTSAASSGMGWMVTTDQIAGGQSTGKMSVVDGGANDTPKALESVGDVVSGSPYPWAGVMYMPGVQPMQAVDLSARKSLHFWARGDGKTYHVMMFAASRGQMPLIVDFVAGPEWKEYSLPFSAFAGIDGHDIMGIAFTAGPQPGHFAFRIDDVSLR